MTRHPRLSDRQELSQFLRTRRDRLKPADIGLPMTGRRRTPGLRREEVAQAAGVGVTWYTWLEQGREMEVSAHFLERIAHALRLDANERTHLFSLAQNRAPPERSVAGLAIKPVHQRMLEAIEGPAYIANPCLDVAAWNECLSAVFGDLAHLPAQNRNMLWLMFASPEHQAALPDWEGAARSMLARFRIEYGRNQKDPRFLTLIERLRGVSPSFRAWWPQHDVTVRSEKPKRFTVPGIGELELDQTVLLLEDAPNLRIVVYAPANRDSAGKVALLTRAWRERHSEATSR
nr:helix-turn-helix transcriptional regulator [Mesorhizobium loti]